MNSNYSILRISFCVRAESTPEILNHFLRDQSLPGFTVKDYHQNYSDQLYFYAKFTFITNTTITKNIMKPGRSLELPSGTNIYLVTL